MNILRQLVRVWQTIAFATPNPFVYQAAAYSTATWLTRMFYVITLFLSLSWMSIYWTDWLAIVPQTLLWPVRWLMWVAPAWGVPLLLTTTIITTTLATVAPENQAFRLLAFVGYLELVALANSFGKINHSSHAWIVVAFVFIFLPFGGWDKRGHSITERHKFLTVFKVAQIFVCLFYSMSGVLKIVGAISQMAAGELHAFHPLALAYQIAERMSQTNTMSLLGPALLNLPWLGWPFYLAALYLETFSLVAAFRPSIHRFWGVSLLLLHVGNYVLLSVIFFENVLLIGLLYLYSPFQPPTHKWRDLLMDLPLIGDAVRWVGKRRPLTNL